MSFLFQLLKNKQGNDRYAERGMNTFNEPQKCKLVQTSKIGFSVRTSMHLHVSIIIKILMETGILHVNATQKMTEFTNT